MSRKLSIIILQLLLLIGAGNNLQAQNEISSPYSGFGVGILTDISNAPMTAMGGLSYAIQSPYWINFRNPASYTAFDSLTFLGDMAFSVVHSSLKTTDFTQTGSFARFSYLTLGLPVTRHWRTSLGFLPYSDVGYKIKDSTSFANYSYDGTGGLMQLYWGNAFKLAKGLSLGMNISYLFGTLNNIRYVEYDGDNFWNHQINIINKVDGLHLNGGIQYFFNIKQHHKIGLGFVTEVAPYIRSTETLSIMNYRGVYTSQNSDTNLLINSEIRKGTMQFPLTFGGGITYTFKGKLLIGTDVKWQNWSKYRNLDHNDSLSDAITATIGLQWTPNPDATQYAKRMSFRAGIKYSTGYFSFNKHTVEELHFSLGIGFPLRQYSTQSSVNLTLEYVKMGTVSNNMILQDVYRMTFSFILHEKWYQRTKLE